MAGLAIELVEAHSSSEGFKSHFTGSKLADVRTESGISSLRN